jgi:hypothetical protein
MLADSIGYRRAAGSIGPALRESLAAQKNYFQ